jgi:hypothetical protein
MTTADELAITSNAKNRFVASSGKIAAYRPIRNVSVTSGADKATTYYSRVYGDREAA